MPSGRKRKHSQIDLPKEEEEEEEEKEKEKEKIRGGAILLPRENLGKLGSTNRMGITNKIYFGQTQGGLDAYDLMPEPRHSSTDDVLTKSVRKDRFEHDELEIGLLQVGGSSIMMHDLIKQTISQERTYQRTDNERTEAADDTDFLRKHKWTLMEKVYYEAKLLLRVFTDIIIIKDREFRATQLALTRMSRPVAGYRRRLGKNNVSATERNKFSHPLSLKAWMSSALQGKVGFDAGSILPFWRFRDHIRVYLALLLGLNVQERDASTLHIDDLSNHVLLGATDMNDFQTLGRKIAAARVDPNDSPIFPNAGNLDTRPRLTSHQVLPLFNILEMNVKREDTNPGNLQHPNELTHGNVIRMWEHLLVQSEPMFKTLYTYVYAIFDLWSKFFTEQSHWRACFFNDATMQDLQIVRLKWGLRMRLATNAQDAAYRLPNTVAFWNKPYRNQEEQVYADAYTYPSTVVDQDYYDDTRTASMAALTPANQFRKSQVDYRQNKARTQLAIDRLDEDNMLKREELRAELMDYCANARFAGESLLGKVTRTNAAGVRVVNPNFPNDFHEDKVPVIYGVGSFVRPFIYQLDDQREWHSLIVSKDATTFPLHSYDVDAMFDGDNPERYFGLEGDGNDFKDFDDMEQKVNIISGVAAPNGGYFMNESERFKALFLDGNFRLSKLLNQYETAVGTADFSYRSYMRTEAQLYDDIISLIMAETPGLDLLVVAPEISRGDFVNPAKLYQLFINDGRYGDRKLLTDNRLTDPTNANIVDRKGLADIEKEDMMTEAKEVWVDHLQVFIFGRPYRVVAPAAAAAAPAWFYPRELPDFDMYDERIPTRHWRWNLAVRPFLRDDDDQEEAMDDADFTQLYPNASAPAPDPDPDLPEEKKREIYINDDAFRARELKKTMKKIEIKATSLYTRDTKDEFDTFRGVFATKDMKQGQRIGWYTGRVFSEEEYNRIGPGNWFGVYAHTIECTNANFCNGVAGPHVDNHRVIIDGNPEYLPDGEGWGGLMNDRNYHLAPGSTTSHRWSNARGYKNNCAVFQNGEVSLISDVKKGDELTWSFGKPYWTAFSRGNVGPIPKNWPPADLVGGGRTRGGGFKRGSKRGSNRIMARSHSLHYGNAPQVGSYIFSSSPALIPSSHHRDGFALAAPGASVINDWWKNNR